MSIFIAWAMTYNTGNMSVANIGVGMGMANFFLLSIFLGVEYKRAMPTAIVVGAWTAALPAYVNWVIIEAAPYIRLIWHVVWRAARAEVYVLRRPHVRLGVFFLRVKLRARHQRCRGHGARDDADPGEPRRREHCHRADLRRAGNQSAL